MFLRTKNYENFTVEDSDFNILYTFDNAENCTGCLNGDIVKPDKKGCSLLKRSVHPILSGILELMSKYKYGMTSRGNPMYRFVPFRKEYPPFIVGSSHRDTSCNQLAIIQFESWTASLPRGNLIRLIGPCGDLDKEKEALLYTYSPAKCGVFNIPEVSFENRESVPANTFNIDPDGCKDVDDVISLELLNLDVKRMWITISDVSEYIKEGSPIDESARQMGFTTYANGIAVRPMLQANLSEDHCSLVPSKQRLGISLIIDWKDRQIINLRWSKTIVVVNRVYTYDTATRLDKKYRDMLTEFTGLVSINSEDPHNWIEQCMLFYNKEAAKILRNGSVGILRKHKEADLERLAFYESLDPSLAILASTAAEPCLATDSDVSHYGLNSDVYCQITSPLRRYADLINQRALKYFLWSDPLIETPTMHLIRSLKSREKDLKRYERNLFFIEQLATDNESTVDALILDSKVGDIKVSYRIWVYKWKRVVKWKTAVKDLNPRLKVTLKWYANMNQPSWDKRIIFERVV
jgi:exoribonuclease R